MDVAMNGTNSDDTWIQNIRPEVSKVSVAIVLLAVITFLLQLGLVLTVMYRCWRKDKKICRMRGLSFSKASVTEDTQCLAGQQRDCSSFVAKVPTYTSILYVIPCYREEPAAFPPWDLVQSV